MSVLVVANAVYGRHEISETPRERIDSKAAGKMSKNRRRCLSAPNNALWVASSGLSNRKAPETLARKGGRRSNQAIIHPRFAALVQIGLIVIFFAQDYQQLAVALACEPRGLGVRVSQKPNLGPSPS
jgi:hypothetical protein